MLCGGVFYRLFNDSIIHSLVILVQGWLYTYFFDGPMLKGPQKGNKKGNVPKRYHSLDRRKEATRTPDPYVPNVVRYQLRYFPILRLQR